jgi:hypothetical protein
MNDDSRGQTPESTSSSGRQHQKLSKQIYIELAAFSDSIHDRDERDAIQKKTFTKWVNKHLKKAGRNCRDLFEDLRDGHNLLSLLEVLSGEILPRERGRMRFHAIQNVETALRFLRYKEIKLVNIRGEDIVDGNPKLTLGLIWTIILHFQVGLILDNFGPTSIMLSCV